MLKPVELVARDGDDRAVAREEVLAERLWGLRPVDEVLRGLVFVAPATVEVVHQHPFVAAVVEREHG